MEAIDFGALFFFQSLRRPWLDQGMIRLTHAGDTVVLISLTILAAVFFLLARRPGLAMVVVVSILLSYSVTRSVKRIILRPRPEVANPAIERPDSPSFPSGHASESTSCYGAIGLAAASMLRRRRGLVVFIFFAIPFLIGVTRLYLGVHYVFDVVAGWTVGLACVFFALGIERAFFGRSEKLDSPSRALDLPQRPIPATGPPDGIRPATSGMQPGPLDS